jgi:hypothetical protein
MLKSILAYIRGLSGDSTSPTTLMERRKRSNARYARITARESTRHNQTVSAIAEAAASDLAVAQQMAAHSAARIRAHIEAGNLYAGVAANASTAAAALEKASKA